MILQRTLKSTVTMTGVGLHSGKNVEVRIKAGRPNSGIKFVRTDLETAFPISAHYSNVTNTQLATSLGRGKVSISTVEHLLSALHGAGVDNALVEVEGAEVPILDGSARPFYDAIREAGVVTQRAYRKTLVLRRKVEIKLAEKWAVAEPSSRLEIHGSIDWDHPAIGYQEFHYIAGKTSFDELADARTFGFLRDVEALKRMGLASGGSLDNAVVLDDFSILNPGGLRSPDEFVKHKVLDALGDFMLAGYQLQAKIRLHRAGHDLHTQLLKAILMNPENFEIIDHEQTEERRSGGVRAALAGTLAASLS